MTDALPPDPFGPPEEVLNVMRGLSTLYSAGMIAGLSESVMTQFISNIFLAFSIAQQGSQQHEE